MYALPDQEFDDEFAACWQAAGLHIQDCAGGELNSWLKADLNFPILEHLSFRLGNELFYIRVEDVEDIVVGPSSREGLLSIAEGCNGQACLMPMRHTRKGWVCELPGWGLQDLRTGQLLHPPQFISDKLIVMTDWELNDFAVQIVRDRLKDEGRQVNSAQGNPNVSPAIWFVGDTGPEWVVVKAARYPLLEAPVPENIVEIGTYCAKLGKRGHFASVAVASTEQFLEMSDAVLPLYRGMSMNVEYEGLELVYTDPRA